MFCYVTLFTRAVKCLIVTLFTRAVRCVTVTFFEHTEVIHTRNKAFDCYSIQRAVRFLIVIHARN